MALGRDVSGFVKTALALVALYLVLVHATGARRLISAGSEGFARIARTLQGR